MARGPKRIRTGIAALLLYSLAILQGFLFLIKIFYPAKIAWYLALMPLWLPAFFIGLWLLIICLAYDYIAYKENKIYEEDNSACSAKNCKNQKIKNQCLVK